MSIQQFNQSVNTQLYEPNLHTSPTKYALSENIKWLLLAFCNPVGWLSHLLGFRRSRRHSQQWILPTKLLTLSLQRYYFTTLSLRSMIQKYGNNGLKRWGFKPKRFKTVKSNRFNHIKIIISFKNKMLFLVKTWTFCFKSLFQMKETYSPDVAQHACQLQITTFN